MLRSKSPNARAVISAARPNHDLGIPRSIIHGINRLPFAVVVVALFLALASVTYWPILFGRIPLPVDLIVQFPPWEPVREGLHLSGDHAEIGDLVTQFYPWRAYAAESVRQGVLPLWNPYLLLGSPFLANAQSSLFYPLNGLYYLLPTPTAWGIGFILRTMLAGCFTTLFVRSLGATRLGAVFSGIVFAFSAFTTVWQSQPLGDAALWLPIVLFSIDRLRVNPRASGVGLASLVFAMPALAGHPETAAKVTLAGAAWAGYRLLWSPTHPVETTSRVRYVASFALAGLIAFGLAAVQTIPTAEWLGQLHRTLDDRWGARPVSEIATFLSRDITRNPSSAGIFIPEGAGYVGLLTLLAASLAPWHRNRRDAIFFLLAIVLSLQIIYGVGPLYWLSQNAPVIRGMKNWRLLLVVTFALATLAGLGVSALQSHLASRRSPVRTVAVVCGPIVTFLVVGAGLIYLHPFENAQEPALVWYRGSTFSAFLAIAGIATILAALTGFLKGKKLAVSVLAICCIDLVSFSHGYIPFVSPETVFVEPPSYRFLKDRDPSVYRVLSLDNTVGPNFEMYYDLSSGSGYDAASRTTTDVLMPLTLDQARINPIHATRIVEANDRVLDLMNVKYLFTTTRNASASTIETRPDRFSLVYSEGTLRVFENRTVLPRAMLVPATGVEVHPDDQSALARLHDATFDPAHSVIVREAPSFASATRPGEAVAQSRVTHIAVGINDTTVRAEVAEPAVLVVSQAYYPGWKVLVDDEEAALLRVNHAFSGVALKPGSHHVRLVFDPLSFRAGLALSAAALLVAVGLLLFEPVRALLRRPAGRASFVGRSDGLRSR